MTNRKNGTKSGERRPDGTFAPGNSGKPKGTRHRVTRAVVELLEGQSEALTQTAINSALEGDTTALRLCLERIAPPLKDRPIEVELPPVQTASDAMTASSAILKAVADGEVTPLEGAALASLLDGHRKLIEAADFEQRLSALEKQHEGK